VRRPAEPTCGRSRTPLQSTYEQIGADISRTLWAWIRVGAGAAVLGALVVRLGTGPFVDGLELTTLSSLVAALGVTGLTTLCCAWRWRVVAGGLGLDLPLRAAVAAYYRSQFLNATLPGGVVGDVHRAVRHGRDAGSMSRSVRAVVWERSLGQVVQVLLTVGVLVLMPSPLRPGPPVAVGATLLCVVVAGVTVVVLARRGWLPAVPASVLATLGHATLFLVAVRTTGASLPLSRALPVALLVLLAAAIPANLAGWGPREGAAAWAFAAVGLTAAQGVAVSVVYGMMALVATMPGVVVLLVGALRTARTTEVVYD
jgi:uncharacterized membrane protein YbhN (UPF0104 family)